MEEYFSREAEPLRVKTFENLKVLTEILSSRKLNSYQNSVSICEWNGQLRRFKRWAAKVVTRESDIDSIDYRLRAFPGLVRQLREAIYELHLRLNDVQSYLLTDEYRVGSQLGLWNLYSRLAAEIDNLEALSKQTLNPTPYNLEMDSETFFQFNESDDTYVRETYPHADERLVDQLAESISGRRAMLRHRQKQKKPDPLMNEMVSDKPPWLAHLSRDYRTLEDKVVSSVPLPGLAFKHDLPFECPYCFCTIAITSKNQWAKHVLHDLMAYQCVYPDCSERDRWFTTSVEWREHQWRDHGQEKVCPLCKKEARCFVLEDHTAEHLESLAVFVLHGPGVGHKSVTVPPVENVLGSPAPIPLPRRRKSVSVSDLGLCFYSEKEWERLIGAIDVVRIA